MKISGKMRFLLSLTTLLICVVMGTVCVQAEMIPYQQEETTTLSEEDAKTYVDGKINVATIKSHVEEQVNYVAQSGTWTKEELEYAANMTSYQTDLYVNFAKAVGDEPCGEYKSYDGLEIKEVEDADAVDASVVIHFKKKDLKMTVHITCFDNIKEQVISTEFGLADDGKESFGDKMAEAGSNTIMGMGVVFSVLIFICLIITGFNIIPKITQMIENRKAGKGANEERIPNRDVPVATRNIPVVSESTDDTELIAVIAAAIAASEQVSTDSFVVRSIRRRF